MSFDNELEGNLNGRCWNVSFPPQDFEIDGCFQGDPATSFSGSLQVGAQGGRVEGHAGPCD